MTGKKLLTRLLRCLWVSSSGMRLPGLRCLLVKSRMSAFERRSIGSVIASALTRTRFLLLTLRVLELSTFGTSTV